MKFIIPVYKILKRKQVNRESLEIMYTRRLSSAASYFNTVITKNNYFIFIASNDLKRSALIRDGAELLDVLRETVEVSHSSYSLDNFAFRSKVKLVGHAKIKVV